MNQHLNMKESLKTGNQPAVPEVTQKVNDGNQKAKPIYQAT